MLKELNKVWEQEGGFKLCVKFTFCQGDWINFGKGRELANCVLTANCVG